MPTALPRGQNRLTEHQCREGLFRPRNTRFRSPAEIRKAFEDANQELSAGCFPLKWGHGSWRDLISAKALFRTTINQWFQVPDESQNGRSHLKGREAENAVAVDLLRNHAESMPSDFKEFREHLERAMAHSAR